MPESRIIDERGSPGFGQTSPLGEFVFFDHMHSFYSSNNPFGSAETAWKVIKGEKIKRNIDTGVDIISKDNVELRLDFLRELLK